MKAHLVQNRSSLAEALSAIERSDSIALDTEFVGEHTYEPVLCLIQVAAAGEIWLIDPMNLHDLDAFWTLITAPERELVVLAAREEVRFCLRYAGRIPGKMIDVQLAAGLVGLGYPLSHTNLVRKVLGVNVKSGETFTDWRKRPLTTAQLEYAADDVRYLADVLNELKSRADELDRVGWLEAESARYAAKIRDEQAEERWFRLPGANGLSRRELAAARELWFWRDDTAKSQNVPPRRIMRDEIIVEIAKRRPAGVAELYAVRGLDRVLSRTLAPAVVSAVQTALQVAEKDLPSLQRRADPPQVGTVAQLLSVVMGGLASQHQVDPALLATTSDLQELVRWRLAGEPEDGVPAILQGWRGEILGKPLSAVLGGQASIRVSNLDSPNPFQVQRDS